MNKLRRRKQRARRKQYLKKLKVAAIWTITEEFLNALRM
jgi:hypothetical protein